MRRRKSCLPSPIEILGIQTFHDKVNGATWLKPGAWGGKAKSAATQCAEVFALLFWGIAVPLRHSRRFTAADHVQAGAERDDISPSQVGLLSF
jgi:hypothetical protein